MNDIPNQPEQAATDTDALETSENSMSSAYGNGVRDSGHDVRITRSHDYDMNSQLVREEIASLRLLNSETEQRIRHTEDAHQDNRNLAMKLHDAQLAREAGLQQQAQAQQASQAQTDATNANSQALAQLALSVKLSDGIYLP
jgi:hypothetical protein